MDRIDLFRVFARVVECTSFTRAAETLGMPRSSVSVAVSELEARLGALLLQRTTRKVTPTPDGEAFYNRCLRVLADVEEAEGLFRSGTTKLSGHFAVRYASPSSGRVEPWEWVEAGSVRTLPMQGRVTVNGAEAAIACCLAGLGLIQIPAYDVRRHIEANELVEIMPMTLLYPHRRHLSRRVQLFADWIERLMRETIAG